jgi:hypothetical protein
VNCLVWMEFCKYGGFGIKIKLRFWEDFLGIKHLHTKLDLLSIWYQKISRISRFLLIPNIKYLNSIERNLRISFRLDVPSKTLILSSWDQHAWFYRLKLRNKELLLASPSLLPMFRGLFIRCSKDIHFKMNLS